jgi:hypothetical protein
MVGSMAVLAACSNDGGVTEPAYEPTDTEILTLLGGVQLGAPGLPGSGTIACPAGGTMTASRISNLTELGGGRQRHVSESQMVMNACAHNPPPLLPGQVSPGRIVFSGSMTMADTMVVTTSGVGQPPFGGIESMVGRQRGTMTTRVGDGQPRTCAMDMRRSFVPPTMTMSGIMCGRAVSHTVTIPVPPS